MKNNRSQGVFIFLLAAMAAITGCAAPQMAVPADVAAQLEQLPITERSGAKGALAKETFKVEPYAVTEVDRKWTSTSTRSIMSFSDEDLAGGYDYTFSADGAAVKSQCLSGRSKKSVGFGSGFAMSKQASKIGCTCDFAGSGAEIVLNAGDDGKYTGELKTRSGKTLTATAIYEREGTMKSPDPTGFRVDAQAPAGAVDILGKGRIWLNKTLDAADRADLACLFSGLMLYIPPKAL